jgi:phage terminase large subunit
MSKTVTGPDLHKGQLRAVALVKSKARNVTVVAPRQTGKSFLAMQVVLYWAINNPGAEIFWVSPIYAQAKKVFDQIYDAVHPSGLIRSANKSDVTIKFRNNSKLYFKSAERPDNLRGYTGDYMVVDEAAYMQDEVYKAVLRPIMLVRGKCTLFISTPRGSNWFKEMYDLGQSTDAETADYASCRMHYRDNPFVDPQEIENARLTLPAAIFAAEYEGSFEDSGRNVFDLNNTHTFDAYPKPQGKVVCGIDLGRANDYTVATFMDAKGQIVGMYRENKRDWSEMTQAILNLVRQFNASVLVEKNSIGDVIFETIKKQWNDTHPFNTSSKSKQEIIEGLVLDLNEGNLYLPSESLFAPMLFELNIYEYSYSPKTRSITYSAPASMHDDTVMSLAITNYHRKQNQNYGSYAVLGGYR